MEDILEGCTKAYKFFTKKIIAKVFPLSTGTQSMNAHMTDIERRLMRDGLHSRDEVFQKAKAMFIQAYGELKLAATLSAIGPHISIKDLGSSLADMEINPVNIDDRANGAAIRLREALVTLVDSKKGYFEPDTGTRTEKAEYKRAYEAEANIIIEALEQTFRLKTIARNARGG